MPAVIFQVPVSREVISSRTWVAPESYGALHGLHQISIILSLALIYKFRIPIRALRRLPSIILKLPFTIIPQDQSPITTTRHPPAAPTSAPRLTTQPTPARL